MEGARQARGAQWLRWCVPLLAIVPFLPALGGELLGWDDRRALLDFTAWRGLSWASVRWAFTTLDMGMYRPLTWLSYAVDHAFTDLDPAGFHRTNLILHGLLAALCWAALSRLSTISEGKPPPAWSVALVTLGFSVHPLRVQVVAWVSARADILASALLVASVLAWLTFIERRKLRWRVAWHALFAASLLAKPVALGAPIAVWALWRWLHRKKPELEAPHRVDLVIGLGLSAAIAVPLALAKNVITKGGGVPPLPPSASFTALHNLVQPLWKTVWPSGLGVVEPAYPFDPLEVVYVAGALVAVALSLGVWRARARFPGLMVTAIAWAALMAPVLGIIPFGYEITADRFSFTPSLALLPGALWLLGLARQPRWVALATAALVIGWGVFSFKRTEDWLSSEALWRRTLANNPRSALALSGLGDAAMKENRIAEGQRFYLRAIEWLPPYEPTLVGLGFADLAQGRPLEAIPKLEKYLSTHPENRAGRRFLWQAYQLTGRFEEAEQLGRPEGL